MPYVLERNREAIEDKILSVARYLNLSDTSFVGFINWILDIRKKLEIPHTLKELINENTKFDEMSKMAFKDPSTGGNPITLKENDFLELYKNSYDGKILSI
tara:strand:- start:185 stop:487 length:303 start_codon:yes stop_codon:yes gene_type:complete